MYINPFARNTESIFLSTFLARPPLPTTKRIHNLTHHEYHFWKKNNEARECNI
jgi:hypothetical protein